MTTPQRTPPTESESAAAPEHWLISAARRVVGAELHAQLPRDVPESPVEAWQLLQQLVDLDRQALVGELARTFHVEAAKLDAPDPAVVKQLSEALARRYTAIPVSVDGGTLVFATATPADVELEHDLAFAVGRAVRLVVADPAWIFERLDEVFAVERVAEKVLESIESDTQGVTVLDEDLYSDPTPGGADRDPSGIVRRIAATILGDAVTRNASDVHLTDSAAGGLVRYRIDGIMEQVLTMPVAVYVRVVSRLKVIAGLDITDRLRPQDGRARIIVRGQALDLRVSTVPVQGAHERMVVRLLSSAIIQSLDTMDMAEPERSQLIGLMAQADGLILLTGPTGSGKTTTLHAALKQRLSPDVTIMTIENPVEYKIEGVSQVQVEPKQGVTFSSVLRAMLRQDPDILLVGEIRDPETAETAAQASMTGHLVLSTVHADDAPNALLRLKDLGLDAETIGEAFRGAASQRLLRRLCPSCKRPAEAPWTPEDERLRDGAGAAPGARPVGCTECRGTGYRGRIPIHQVFVVSPPLRAMIRRGADLVDLRSAAEAEGMRTLSASAATRIAAGDTTVEEAVRVLGSRFWEELQVGATLPASETSAAGDSAEPETVRRPARASVALTTAAALSEVAAMLVEEPAVAPGSAGHVGVDSAAAHDPPVDERSVAVLPFINLSADPAQDYFTNGITEDIITSLAQVTGLGVAAQTSSFAFKDLPPELATIGRTLRVATVLQGSVRSAGTRVRIAVRLMNAADSRQLWAERFDRTLDDIFAVQDEIAQAVTRHFREPVAARDVAVLAPPTTLRGTRETSITAYQFFLRGREANQQRTPAGFSRAIELFSWALATEPSYARAYAGLAEAHIGMGSYFFAPFRESRERAAAALVRAGGEESDLAIVHSLAAQSKLYLGTDWRGAGTDLDRALAIEPENAIALALRAMLHGMTGDTDACRSAAERAISADPLSAHIRALAVSTFPHEGPPGCDAAAALAAHEAGLALEQHSVANLWMSAIRLGDLGQFDDAEKRLNVMDTLTRGAAVVAGLRVRVLAQANRVAEARAMRGSLSARAANEYVAPGVLLIGGLLGPGEEEEAEFGRILQRSLDDQTGPVATFVAMRTMLEPLLDHPRLGDLVRALPLWRPATTHSP